MIIDCISCAKKFEVNSSLIPEKGRTIQCGSCGHIWFYKPELNNSLKMSKNDNQIKEKEIKINSNNLNNKKKSFSFSKFLSYVVVLLISFIAIILILDTFKTSLINLFPGLELLLYNFFETVKDIYLFSKNLIN